MSFIKLSAACAAVALLALGWGPGSAANAAGSGGGKHHDQISNKRTFRNPSGRAGTFSTQGSIDLTSEYFQAQGTNGRSCASCHIPEDAWSINPGTLQQLFDETDGTHPVFNPLDANNPAMDVSTVDARLAAYSMLLSRGVFRRGGAPRPNSEWDLIAVDDPHGFANLTRLVHWRRVMPTINFAVGSATVNWDGGNTIGTDQHAGLDNQADAQRDRRAAGPAGHRRRSSPTSSISKRRCRPRSCSLHGVGRLDAGGARGGPGGIVEDAEGRGTLRSLRRLDQLAQSQARADRARSGAVQQSQRRRRQLQRLPQLGEQRHQHQQRCSSTSAPRRPRRARRTCRSTPSATERPARSAQLTDAGRGQRHRAVE